MKVLVIGLNGIGLMPTTPRKARLLINSSKAVVVKKYPFTIRLLYKTGTATQKVVCGIDTGAQHIGIAVTQENKVLLQAEVELRKSMEKRQLMETRKSYRHCRRYRKTPYRHPKFRFHTKRVYDSKKQRWVKVPNTMQTKRKAGWLPPSTESKVQHHIGWINAYMNALPKSAELVIEAARFDAARMKDPTIHGEDYQKGRLYDYENVKAYVLAKFDYKCPVCGHKFDNDHKPRMHHVTFRKNGATNNPDEYAPICEKCHTPENHLPGGELDKLRKLCKRKEYRETVFMNILRKRLYRAFPWAEFTYGNITAADRKRLNLDKTHALDAVAISLKNTEYDNAVPLDMTVYYKQVRKKKRSLHEATPRKGRKEPNRLALRHSKNTKMVVAKNGTFQRYDKVLTKDGRIGYITGFTGKGAYIQTLEGEYIQPNGKINKKHNLSDLRKVKSNNNWISEEAGVRQYSRLHLGNSITENVHSAS